MKLADDKYRLTINQRWRQNGVKYSDKENNKANLGEKYSPTGRVATVIE